MVVVYITILASPFIIGGAIAASHGARDFVARHYAICAAAGWTAFAFAFPAAAVLDGGLRVGTLAILCPLMALTFWRPSDGPDGNDGGGGGGGGPDPSAPTPPEIDWGRFMRDLDDYAASTKR